jgi:hypothetical protein
MHGEGEDGERQLLATGRINSYNHPEFLIEQPWACNDTLDAIYAVVLRCEGSESARSSGSPLAHISPRFGRHAGASLQ